MKLYMIVHISNLKYPNSHHKYEKSTVVAYKVKKFITLILILLYLNRFFFHLDHFNFFVNLYLTLKFVSF